MTNNRRQFIKRSGLLLGGAATLSGTGIAAAASPAKRNTPNTAAPAKRNAPNAGSPLTALLDRLRIKTAHLTGGSVLGTHITPACISIAALVSDGPAAALSRLPGNMVFSKIWADGDTLLLEDGAAASYYKISFHDRAGWSALTARLAVGEGIQFAHQALMRDRSDAAAAVSDPFGVLTSGGARALRLVGTQDATPAGRLRTVLEGVSESALYRLVPAPGFAALRAAVLDRVPADAAEARSVVDEFTAAAAVLALHSSSVEMTALLNSRLISASMQSVFGRSGPEIVRVASGLSAQVNMTAGAPWLAGILGTGNLTATKGSVSIEHEDRYASILARQALVQARAACYTTDR